LVGLVVSACSTLVTAPDPFVDLSQRERLPAATESRVEPLRIAVAALLSPEGNIDSYASLADYLGTRFGRPVELVQRRTYAEVNELIARGDVDLAFVCTSAYVAGHSRSEMELLVVPEINDESVYYSTIIVPADSSAADFTDLRDTVFAFTDPMSHTGRVYPTSLLLQMGETPGTFFSSVFFTYSHDRAIEAVADRVADGAAIDSLVLEYALRSDPTLADRIKIVHRSPAFGIPPVVVPAGLSPTLRMRIEDLLLGLETNPDGQSILARLGIDRFIQGEDSSYDSVRDLLIATGIGQ
jgi:phosphonate transport system substrate-binding protein